MLYVLGTVVYLAAILVPTYLSMELGIYLTESFSGILVLCIWMFICMCGGKLLISIANSNNNNQNAENNSSNNNTNNTDKSA